MRHAASFGASHVDLYVDFGLPMLPSFCSLSDYTITVSEQFANWSHQTESSTDRRQPHTRHSSTNASSNDYVLGGWWCMYVCIRVGSVYNTMKRDVEGWAAWEVMHASPSESYLRSWVRSNHLPFRLVNTVTPNYTTQWHTTRHDTTSRFIVLYTLPTLIHTHLNIR